MLLCFFFLIPFHMKVEGVVSLVATLEEMDTGCSQQSSEELYPSDFYFFFNFEVTWKSHQASISLLENQQKSQIIFNGFLL